MKTKLNTSRENQSLSSRRRDRLVKHATLPELRIVRLLTELGERFIFQKSFFTNYRFFIVDFYIKRRHKLCLEIDGKLHEKTGAYDELRDSFLTEFRKVRVLRITNERAMKITKAQLLKLITK